MKQKKNLKIIAYIIIAIMAIFGIGVIGDTAIATLMGSGYCFAGAMTLLEITDSKTQLLDANDEIFTKVEAEKRSMTDEEKKKVQENNLKMREYELQEESLSFRDNKGREIRNERAIIIPKEKFSLMRTIREFMDSKTINEVARDVNTLGQQEFRRAGLSYSGNLILPAEVRADILAGTALQGQEIISEEKKAILPPLVDKLILAKAGATFLTGLVGNVSIPSYSGTTVAWKSEVAGADDGAGTFGEVEFSPKRLTAKLDVSKLFLAQDGVGAERLLLDNIADAVARKLESTTLGIAVGSATMPQGMGYKVTTGTDTKAAAVVPTYALMVGLETEVDIANALVDKLAYITNSAGRGMLKSIAKGTAMDNIMICENNLVNGYPLLVTNAVAGSAGSDGAGELIVFGNWKDLCICQWGGYDITVDPYSLASENQVRIVINAYFDVKGLRGSLATDVHGSVDTDPDEYAYSFTSLAIKAS